MLPIGSYVWLLGPQLVVLLGHVGTVKCCWGTCMCILMFYSPVSLPVYFLPPYSRYNIIICVWFCLHVFPVWRNASPWILGKTHPLFSCVLSWILSQQQGEQLTDIGFFQQTRFFFFFFLWGFCFHFSCCRYIVSRSGKGKDELRQPCSYGSSCQFLLE